MKLPAGTIIIKRFKGIEYKCEVQPKGRAKIVERITPYKNKDCANSLSTIPATRRNKPLNGLKRIKTDDLIGKDISRPSTKIKCKEFDPETQVMVRVDSKTYIIRNKTE